MFKALKILWLKIRRDYHYYLVFYYDKKSDRDTARRRGGLPYSITAWGHAHKASELNYELHKLKDT